MNTPIKPTQKQVDAAVRWQLHDYPRENDAYTEQAWEQIRRDDDLLRKHAGGRSFAHYTGLILAAHIWHQRNPQTT